MIRCTYHELGSGNRYHEIEAEAFRFRRDQVLELGLGAGFEIIGREAGESWEIMAASGPSARARLLSFALEEEGPLLTRSMRADGSYSEERSPNAFVSLASGCIDLRTRLDGDRVFWLDGDRDCFTSARTGFSYHFLVVGSMAYFHEPEISLPAQVAEIGVRSRPSDLALRTL